MSEPQSNVVYDEASSPSRIRPVRSVPGHSAGPSYSKTTSRELTLRCRPNHGTLGSPVDLLVNWYSLTIPRVKLFLHEVEVFEEKKVFKGRRPQFTLQETKNSALRRWVFWEVVRQNPRDFGCCDSLVFDDIKFLWATKSVIMRNDEFRAANPEKANGRVVVKVRHMKEFFLDVNNNEHLISQIVRDERRDYDTAQISAIFLKNLLSQKARFVPGSTAQQADIEFSERFTRVDGSMVFIPRLPKEIQFTQVVVAPGVRAWLGLYAAIKRMENFDPVVNFGLVNKLFWSLNMNLLTFYCEVMEEMEGTKPGFTNDPPVTAEETARRAELAMSRAQRERFSNRLEGCCLKCGHAATFDQRKREWYINPDRHYKFIRLSDLTAANHFINRMSLAEFYRHNGIRLQYPNLPLCEVKTGKTDDKIPMELLMMYETPHRYDKMLNLHARMQLTKKLARDPQKHFLYTNRLMNKLGLSDNRFLQNFGTSVAPKMIETVGRVLPTPTVQDGSEGSVVLKAVENSFQLRLPFLAAKNVLRFVVIKATDRVSKDDMIKFYQGLYSVFEEKQLNLVSAERDHPLWYDPWEEDQDLSEKVGAMTALFRDKILAQNADSILVVLFFTTLVHDLYGEIKHVMDLQFGTVSQCIDDATVRKTVDSESKRVYYQIFMKLNTKLNGTNHILTASPLHPLPIEGVKARPPGVPGHANTLFVGIDVTHPSPTGKLDDISIAAIVGNFDLHATRYAVQVRAQMRCYESVQAFEEKFTALLARYLEENGNFPEKVVVLRDGVSDSEMVRTAAIELNSMREAWNRACEGKEDLQFTYIVVQKRHHTRFYPKDLNEKKDDKENRNIVSGTVVDCKTVSPKFFDFYLASHHAGIGTCRPAHYIVLYDEQEMSADRVQEMCFNLCFLYARCSKPISKPAPVHYAHLACERARYHYISATEARILEKPSAKGDREGEQAYLTRLEMLRSSIERHLTASPAYPGMYFV